MRSNAVYVLLYTSGLYTLALAPPVSAAVALFAEPLRLAIAVLHLPFLVRALLAFLLFDALAYAVHRAAHASPLLWRFHRVHHSEEAHGVSTTFRFHVVEILWRLAVQFLPLSLLGIAAGLPTSLYLAFVAFNVLAHSDLPWSFGAFLVSPAYHAVHHRDDDHANFAMFLPLWDVAFGTTVGDDEGPPAVYDHGHS